MLSRTKLPNNETVKQQPLVAVKILVPSGSCILTHYPVGYCLPDHKLHPMTTLLLLAAGILCFALFFKSIDYFEKF